MEPGGGTLYDGGKTWRRLRPVSAGACRCFAWRPRRITHPIWRHVRCTCLGNATPDCGAPDLPRSLFPALPEMPPGFARPVFSPPCPLSSPMRLPSALL